MKVTSRALVDRSSVEVFGDAGQAVITSQAFPIRPATGWRSSPMAAAPGSTASPPGTWAPTNTDRTRWWSPLGLHHHSRKETTT